MNISVPLTPHLDQFVHEQLATGRFQSEGDVVQAALRLMEGQTQFTKASLRQDIQQVFGVNALGSPATRRSPRGLLADIPSHISFDDIKDARSEMWSGLPHGRT